MKEIIELIKHCRKLGVSHVEYKDVKVSFFEQGKVSKLPQKSKEGTINDEMDRLLVEDPLSHELLMEKALLQG